MEFLLQATKPGICSLLALLTQYQAAPFTAQNLPSLQRDIICAHQLFCLEFTPLAGSDFPS